MSIVVLHPPLLVAEETDLRNRGILATDRASATVSVVALPKPRA